MLAILKDTSIYAIGDLLTKGIGFFAIVFYAHFITQADMGVYGYIIVIIGFATAFLILGMDNAYARYFFEYKEHRQKQILTTTLFVFLIFWVVFVLFLPLTFSSSLSILLLKDSSYASAIFFAILSLPLKLLSSMSNQALRNQFKTKQFIVFNFFTAFFSVSFAMDFIEKSYMDRYKQIRGENC